MSGSDARLFHQLVARVDLLEKAVETLETLVEAMTDRLPPQSANQSGRREPPPARDGKAGIA